MPMVWDLHDQLSNEWFKNKTEMIAKAEEKNKSLALVDVSNLLE